MPTSPLHVFDLQLCEYVHFNIHQHLDDESLRQAVERLAESPVWRFIAEAYKPEPAPPEKLPFLLHRHELEELEQGVRQVFTYKLLDSAPRTESQASDPNATAVEISGETEGSRIPAPRRRPFFNRAPRYWFGSANLHPQSVKCTAEIREKLSRSDADEWSERSARFSEDLEADNLLVADGTKTVAEWIREIRRHKCALGYQHWLPRPDGDFPTPTFPAPPTPAKIEEVAVGGQLEPPRGKGKRGRPRDPENAKRDATIRDLFPRWRKDNLKGSHQAFADWASGSPHYLNVTADIVRKALKKSPQS